MQPDHEKRIWNSFKKGEWEAYAQLYDLYYRRLNNYGYKFTRDVSLIEDAIQDLFVKLWTNKDSLGEPPSVRNYMYKALRNTLFRKMKVQARFLAAPLDDYNYTFEVSYDSQMILEEDERRLQEIIKGVISNLPARQQEIVYLRFYEGLIYEEIADIMSINVTSVYKLWYKAMDNLKDSLHPLFCWMIFCVFTITSAEIRA
jgi:RNA polymerase sigma factor (sigma-70 family)